MRVSCPFMSHPSTFTTIPPSDSGHCLAWCHPESLRGMARGCFRIWSYPKSSGLLGTFQCCPTATLCPAFPPYKLLFNVFYQPRQVRPSGRCQKPPTHCSTSPALPTPPWTALSRQNPGYPWVPSPLPRPGEQWWKSPVITQGRRAETFEDKLCWSFPRALSFPGQRALHVTTTWGSAHTQSVRGTRKSHWL